MRGTPVVVLACAVLVAHYIFVCFRVPSLYFVVLFSLRPCHTQWGTAVMRKAHGSPHISHTKQQRNATTQIQEKVPLLQIDKNTRTRTMTSRKKSTPTFTGTDPLVWGYNDTLFAEICYYCNRSMCPPDEVGVCGA